MDTRHKEKIIYRLALFILILTTATFDTFGIEIPKVVSNYIRLFDELSHSDNDIDATERQLAIKNSFAAESSDGIMITDSDIHLIGAIQAKKIPSTPYCKRVKELILDRKITSVSHEVNDVINIYPPSLNGKGKPTHKNTLVTKKIIYAGHEYIIYQEIACPYEDIERIHMIQSSIKNPSSSSSSSSSTPSSNISDIKEFSLNQLHFIAAKYYTNKDYKSAYETYKLITEKYESDYEGWLRLGTMIYFKEGYKIKNNKEVAKDYLIKAYKLSKGSEKTRIEIYKAINRTFGGNRL